MAEQFVCAMCGRTSDRGIDGAALEELKQEFGDVDPADCDLVCDECWQIVKPESNREHFSVYQKMVGDYREMMRQFAIRSPRERATAISEVYACGFIESLEDALDDFFLYGNAYLQNPRGESCQ